MISQRKNSKKYIKSRINRITRTIVIIILISVCLPFFLEFFIWRNNFPSAISNSDWSSFFGSYLGGIIGGFATLLAVRFTLLETRKEYYKDFLVQIIDISALCLDDIRKFKAELKISKLLGMEIYELQDEISIIRNDINLHSAPELTGIEEDLNKELLENQAKIEKKRGIQNDIIKTMQNIENSIRHNFTILNIYLRDISVGNDFLISIRCSLESVSSILENLQEYDKYDEYTELLNEENILSKTNDFVEDYKKMYLL